MPKIEKRPSLGLAGTGGVSSSSSSTLEAPTDHGLTGPASDAATPPGPPSPPVSSLGPAWPAMGGPLRSGGRILGGGMISSDEEDEDENREMVGGCCVCSDERGWDENPLVYCDGIGCNVAVHQACYGIVSVPTGPWFCRKCESQERSARVRCELCPSREGALKRTDTNSWAHVVCALYIPEVRFGNVSTMEPIVLGLIPQDRFLKVCYLCEKQGRESKAATGACMQCNRAGCKQSFHVTCAQSAGFLCEEAGNYMDNVKYCGYCEYHYQRINKKIVKTIPAFKPVKNPVREGQSPDSSPEKAFKDLKASSSLSTTGLLPPTSSVAGSSNTSSSSTTSAMSSSVATAAYRKGKKGRKSSSEVKIEAAKFVIDSSSSSNHEDSSKEALHSNHHHHHHHQQQQQQNHHHHHHHHYSSSSHRPGGDPNGRSGMMGPSRSKGEAKETSTLTSTSGGPSRSEDSRPSSRESPQEKQPVILKFGKQDNGQYYKKDVSSSSSGSSSSKKDKDRDKYRSSKDKRSHHREDRAPEADSSGRVTPTSNSNSNSHKSMDKSDKSSARKGETSTTTTSTTSSSSETAAVKVEAMEVDSDAALSAIKTTSCSVSLDKSKVDMKLLAASSGLNGGLNGGLTSTAPAPAATTTTTAKSEVQITPINVASSTKVEADTSSSKKDANSSVIETIKQRGSDVYAMMPDDEDVKPEPLSLLTSKVNSDTDSGVTMTSVQATSMPSSASGSNNANPLESGPAKAMMDASTSSGAVSSSAGQSGQSGPSNGGGVTIEQVAINKKDDTSPPLGKLPRMSASGKRIGRPPKKGMHVATNPMSQLTSSSGSTPISQRTGSPDGEGNVKKKRKSPHKKPVNGTDSPSWMLGATLNMNSPMSKEMNLALLDEMKVHSMYDSSKDKHYVGVPLLGKKASSTTSSGSSQTHNASDMLNAGKSQPQTLEELLERQWEQGSQFLMEQASHFDIASLLSSLHQLKEENVDLEDSVDKLVQRRDHLLAVRARLLALSSLSNTNTNSAPPTPEKAAPPRAGHHQNGPSTHANRSEGSTPHVSPRNHASSATVSPVSIQRAPANLGGAMTAHPASLPPPSSPRLSQQHLPPPPPSASPREHQRSSVPPQQLPSPRDARISPRGTPMENGLDYHTAQPQHHMPPSHYSHRGAPPGRIDGPPSGPPTSHAMNDRMPPMSQAHLLAVATTASRMSSHPAPPPRQSTYPPPGVGQQHNSRSMPTHGMAPHPSMMRGPSQHPPMPSHYGPPPGSHGGSQPGAPSGYQMISPPPSHGGPPPGSMVTLDRTSQQPMRNPPPSHHGSTMRMDKR